MYDETINRCIPKDCQTVDPNSPTKECKLCKPGFLITDKKNCIPEHNNYEGCTLLRYEHNTNEEYYSLSCI